MVVSRKKNLDIFAMLSHIMYCHYACCLYLEILLTAMRLQQQSANLYLRLIARTNRLCETNSETVFETVRDTFPILSLLLDRTMT